MYLLVDEILVVILDPKFPLHVLHLSALLEDLFLNRKHAPPSKLTLVHEANKLTSLFQLLAESTQFLGTLCIPTAGFANLTNLTSAETDVWITVIGFLASFKL